MKSLTDVLNDKVLMGVWSQRTSRNLLTSLLSANQDLFDVKELVFIESLVNNYRKTWNDSEQKQLHELIMEIYNREIFSERIKMPSIKVNNEEKNRAEDVLDDLLACENGMSGVELDFISDMDNKRNLDWYEKQVDWLDKIYERVC